MNDYSGANLGGNYLEAQNTSLLLLDENGVTRELSPRPANPNSLKSVHKVPDLNPIWGRVGVEFGLEWHDLGPWTPPEDLSVSFIAM